MTQDKYFREELAFLKEQGREFTEIHPQLSRFLHGRTMDPDVERLLEGFAFLTARLRQKVEDEFPELTHSMINMLWPNYLRPIPSMCILAFTPKTGLSEQHVIAKGTKVDSKPVLGTKCQFQTCREVKLYPLGCHDVKAQHTRDASTIDIELKLIGDVNVGHSLLDSLRFYLGGDQYSSQMLYLWLNHYLDKISIDVAGTEFPLAKDHFKPVGFDSEDALLPYPTNVYEGYRILQEYLSFSEAFHFFDLSGLDKAIPKNVTGQFTLKLHFSKTLPVDVRITKENFQLYCTPIINLFKHDADPISLTGRQSEYRVVPSSRKPSHYEIFNIESVSGWQDTTSQGKRVRGTERIYSSFESFQHEVERVRNRTALYYRLRVKDSIRADGFESFISFVRSDETTSFDVDEAVSIKLNCTNRLLPLELGVGDICMMTDTSPPFATFTNISVPSQSLRPVLDGSLLWTLISNLSLNYLSLLSKDALSSVLRAYDFKALVDRQAEMVSRQRLDAIHKIESKPVDKILRGLPVRGLQSTLHMDQSGFGSEGDLFLFGTVLSHFFALYASINSFHELHVVNITNQERYTWGTQAGDAATDLVERVELPEMVAMPNDVHEYNFYQLVELLQKLNEMNPEEDIWERQCKLVFSANPSLGFSPSDVNRLDLFNDERMVMMTNFFGLSGAQSPLPGYVVEQLLNEEPGGAKLPFVDFFNNRLINLVYRIWRKYRYFVRFQPDAQDDFSAQLLSLVGLGSPDLRGDTPINWCKMLAYSGTLAGRSRSPQVVSGIIAHCFDLEEVEIRQWTRRTVRIDPSQQTRVGSANSQLGVSSMVGESVVDCNGKFTICISRLSRKKFSDFLPSGQEFGPLCKLVELILREQMAYDLELTMDDNEAPDFVLGGSADIALGWTSFLGTNEKDKSVLIQVRQ